MAEGDVVVRSPFAEAAGEREVAVCRDPAVTGTEEIALHIGEVDISTIQHVGYISFVCQASGNGRQRLALGYFMMEVVGCAR